MVHGGLNASCVPPDLYGERFVRFMGEIFKSNFHAKPPQLGKSKSAVVAKATNDNRV